MTYEDYCEMYENGFDEVRRKSWLLPPNAKRMAK